MEATSTARIYPFLPASGGKRLAPELSARNLFVKSAHAPAHLRVAAFAIDGAVWMIPSLIATALIFVSLMPRWVARYGADEGHLYTIGAVAGTVAGIYFLLFAIAPMVIRGTIGMRLCGLAVVSEAYQKARWAQHLGRFFVEIPSLLFLGAGYVAALLNDGRQTWHDYFSRTYVIRATDEMRLRQNFLKQLATVHVLDQHRSSFGNHRSVA